MIYYKYRKANTLLSKNMNYSNCCGVETHAEKGEIIMCKACKEWAVAEPEESENNFWKYAVPVFLVLAVIYFISRI